MSEDLLQRQLDELHRTWVIEDTDNSPYVEIYMVVNKNGAKGEAFTMEWFPDNRGPDGCTIRVLSTDVFDDNIQEKYEFFGTIVGRVTYRGS